MTRIEHIEVELKAATGGEWSYDADGLIRSNSIAPPIAQTWGKTEEDFPNAENNGRLLAHCGGSNGHAAQLLALCKTLATGVRAGRNVVHEVGTIKDYGDMDAALHAAKEAGL